MSDREDVVVVEAEGGVRVEGPVAARRLRARAGDYHLVVDAPGLLVLRGEGDPAGLEGRARVLMAGEIVSRMTVLELLNVIASSGWRGEMHVLGEGSHRALAIDAGAVKYARSDHPDDRLGQILYRNGALDKAQLDEVLRLVAPERRIGNVLLERGFLTQDQLFHQLQKQVEQIFFSSLLTGSGSYVFVLPDEQQQPPVHSVHLPVQALLMEGVQRIDEMALFRARIPTMDLVPEAVPRSSVASTDASALAVLRAVDGRRTLADIARETGLGEFMTCKAAYGLLQQGLLSLRASRTLDGEAVRRLVEAFNEILRDVFAAVTPHGGVEQTRATLEAWIQGSGYGPIFGERVDEARGLDAAHVVAAMRLVEVESPMEGLFQALHELSTFALFAATTCLPREQELALSRDVTTRLKRIRLG